MSNEKLNKIYAELKQRAAKLNLWNTDFLDRLIIDYKSRKEMKVLALEESRYLKEHIHLLKCLCDSNTPVKYLPNCVKYLGETNNWSWITALLDFRKRSSGEGGRIIGWLNGNRNGFLRYRFNLLGHQRDAGQSKKYWQNGLNLMKNKVFVVTSLNHVCESWEKLYTDEDLHNVLKGVHEKVTRYPVRMDYIRVYIPKDATGSGALRPLGVPELSWRVYLHMWNVLLVWWTMTQLPVHQHAYQPGKGTWTAWKRLIELVEREENIYEFDLSNFFGNVDLRYNLGELIAKGVPEEVSEYLYTLNQSIVHLDHCRSVGDKLDETTHRKIIWNSDGTPNPNLPLDVRETLRAPPDLIAKTEDKLVREGYKLRQEKGVPQGASTSCGLSILNLSVLFERHPKLLMYADDGILFPKSEREAEEVSIEKAGVVKSERKSGWAKKAGVWLKSLKFLGLEYIPSGLESLTGDPPVNYPRLRANTRGLKSESGIGSRLEFTDREQLIAFLSGEYESELERIEAMEKGEGPMNLVTQGTVGEWMNRKLEEFSTMGVLDRVKGLFRTKSGPTLMAGMYNGSWDLGEPGSTELVVRRGSWCDRHWSSYVLSLIYSGRLFIILRRIVQWEDTTKEESEEIIENLNKIGNYPQWQSEVALNSLFKWKGEKCPGYEGEEWKEVLTSAWEHLIKWVKLDIYNSSSQACDDLLTRLKVVRKREDLDWVRGWSELEEVRGYRPLKFKWLKRSKIELLTPEERKASSDREAEWKRKWKRNKARRYRKQLKLECQSQETDRRVSWVKYLVVLSELLDQRQSEIIGQSNLIGIDLLCTYESV